MNFEKLEVWKRSCKLSADVYTQLKDLKDFGFKDQITRSSLSVPSNIAEGMVKPTARDKARYLYIANGSCAELRTQTYIGMRIKYIPEPIGSQWLKEIKEVSAMLHGLLRSIEGSKLEADS
jgi:four helix bundle protein